MLQQARELTNFVHYHTERNHLGMADQTIKPGDEDGQTKGDIECLGLLGGMLQHYHRSVA